SVWNARAGDEDVGGVFAIRDRADRQPIGKTSWHIFEGMHRDIRCAPQQCIIDFLREQSLIPDAGKRDVEDAIAGSADHVDLDCDVRVRILESSTNRFRLPEREATSPRGNL